MAIAFSNAVVEDSGNESLYFLGLLPSLIFLSPLLLVCSVASPLLQCRASPARRFCLELSTTNLVYVISIRFILIMGVNLFVF